MRERKFCKEYIDNHANLFCIALLCIVLSLSQNGNYKTEINKEAKHRTQY